MKLAEELPLTSAVLVRVALDTPLQRLFDYRAPHALAPGTLVAVPLGRRRVVGVVVESGVHSEIPAERIRPLDRVLSDRPVLPREILDLAGFCARYYHHPLGGVLLAALPPRLREAKPYRPPQRWVALSAAGREAFAVLPARAHARRRVLEWLARRPSAALEELRAALGGVGGVLSQLERLGWVVRLAEGLPAAAADAVGPPLTSQQEAAVLALGQGLGRFGVYLLHGVTGSGKTEVYLRVLQKMLADGRQGLVLVPEIALTPQFEAGIRARFPGRRILSLHSALSEGARAENWLAAAAADILLGTRSALFTPLPRLGMIVVDEEHDASFKQQDGLRYSARDLAVVRARQAGVPIVLGSATPSLESWRQAEQGRYGRISLTARAVAGAAAPRARLVDLRRETPEAGLSRPVRQALTDNFQRGGQSLVFINRRGYAPVLYCPACGYVLPCHRCSARLVWHRASGRLKCHHCGHQEAVPEACPQCGQPELIPLGQGTQRVEAALAALLPQARIRRIDRDSMAGREWARFGDAMRAGEIDVLVGTQMLAKGHDFPGLSLVVILDADGALYSPDFRAEERLFAQLLQVAGRAGRHGEAGDVLLQTAFPQHPLYAEWLAGDFAAFARRQLSERKRLGLPPFVHQAVLRSEAPRMESALQFLARAAELVPLPAGVRLFSPAPAAMQRLAGLERAQLLVQAVERAALQRFLDVWRPALETLRPRVTRWHLEVDPLFS